MVNFEEIYRYRPCFTHFADDTTEIKVTITSIERASFPWRIPSFPVITLNFKKVKFTLSNGQQCNGVVNKDIDIEPGRFCCSSHCTIRVENEDLVVLWTLSPLKNTIQSVAIVQVRNVGEETDDYSGEHTLPFKVMGTCYWTSRQDALEEAYTYLHEYNRHVFAKLVEEPENVNDSNAIAVYLMASDNYNKVGYIARELTSHLNPIMKSLDVSVKHIRFSTTFSTKGYYLTLEITKHGMWHNDVVVASKKVK